MWIHEGWTTYLEGIYVEYRWGKDDAIKYINGLKPKVNNERPIIPPRGTNAEPPQDQYFKGALLLNTLRSIINDDTKWWADVHGFYQHFKYQNIMTEDVVAWWNQRTGMNLTPFFDEYLRHAALPVLELRFDPAKHTMSYRWKADEAGLRNAHQRRRPSALVEDHTQHHRLADDALERHCRRVPRRHRPLLRRRQPHRRRALSERIQRNLSMKFLFTLALLLPLAGCGYHQVGAATHIPANVRTGLRPHLPVASPGLQHGDCLH